MKYRFATTLYDDPQGELSKLTQTTTVAEFQSAFEELMNRVNGVSEQLLISFFITGLQQNIRRELLFNRPTTLMATFAMARALEDKFNDTKPHTRSWSKWQPQSTFPSMTTTQIKPVPLPLLSHSHSSTISANPPSSKPPPPHIHNKTNTLLAFLLTPNLPIRRLPLAELHEWREKGLYYSCDQKYNPNHRCNRQFLLLIGAEDDHLDPANEREPPDEEDSVVTGDISSLNALARQANPRSLRLQGKIGSQTFQVLIDSGITHNFIKPLVAERAGAAIQPTTPFRVYIGNCDFLLCTQFCQHVQLTLQGTEFPMDLFVLPIKGADIVLGI